MSKMKTIEDLRKATLFSCCCFVDSTVVSYFSTHKYHIILQMIYVKILYRFYNSLCPTDAILLLSKQQHQSEGGMKKNRDCLLN